MTVRRRRRSALLVSGLMLLSACSTDQSAESTVSTSSTTTTTAPTLASAAFCARATEAVDGHIALNDPAKALAVMDDPSLGDWDRRRLTGVLDDAARQVANGDFDNTLLVDLVNELCGTHFTPVTMTP